MYRWRCLTKAWSHLTSLDMACTLSSGRLITCSDAIGGLRRIYFAQDYSNNVLEKITETDFVIGTLGADTWQANDGGTPAQTIIYQYDLVPDKSGLTVSVSQEPAGGSTLYTQTLTVVLNHFNSADLAEIYNMGHNRVQIFVLDANDNVFLLGAEYGMVLTGGDTFTTGVARSDTPTVTLEFTGSEVAPLYSLAATAGPGTTNYPFDGATDPTTLDVVVGV